MQTQASKKEHQRILEAAGGILNVANPLHHAAEEYLAAQRVLDDLKAPRELIDTTLSIAGRIALTKQPSTQLIDRIVELYIDNPSRVAKACDEHLDRTGQLLGLLREAAKDKQ